MQISLLSGSSSSILTIELYIYLSYFNKTHEISLRQSWKLRREILQLLQKTQGMFSGNQSQLKVYLSFPEMHLVQKSNISAQSIYIEVLIESGIFFCYNLLFYVLMQVPFFTPHYIYYLCCYITLSSGVLSHQLQRNWDHCPGISVIIQKAMHTQHYGVRDSKSLNSVQLCQFSEAHYFILQEDTETGEYQAKVELNSNSLKQSLSFETTSPQIYHYCYFYNYLAYQKVS